MEKRFRRLIKKLSEVELIGLAFILGAKGEFQENEEANFNKDIFKEELVIAFSKIGKSQKKQILSLLSGDMKI